MKEMTLGERIATLRRKKSMTQEELAEQLGVSAQAVSKWENNVCCPDITLLPKLAQIFGVSVDMLLGTEAPPDTAEVKAEQPEPKRKEKRFGLRKIWQIPWAFFVLLLGGTLLWNSLAELGLGFWEIALVDGIIAVGLGAIIARITPFSLGLFGLGVVYLLVKFGVIAWADKYNSLILPILIILFGLSILYGIFFPKKKHKSFKVNGVDVGKKTEFKASEKDGLLQYRLSFSDNRYTFNGEEFMGGEAEVSFGDAVIDLSGCKRLAEGAKLYADVSFGEMTLLLPKHFRAVDAGSSSSFGAAMNIHGSPDADASELFVEAKVSFGEFSVKYI